MKYLHVRKIEDFHPGYKDRTLIWCKTYFNLINAEPEYEMLCEIDKWRFIAFIMLELQIRKPVPLDEEYLSRKGFNFKDRPMALTMNMLHNFVEVVTEESEVRTCGVTQSRVEESRVEVEKKREEKKIATPVFDACWERYPQKVFKSAVLELFIQTVQTPEDEIAIIKALDNYLASSRVKGGFIQDPRRWFKEWRGWVDFKEIQKAGCDQCKGTGLVKMGHATEFCQCPSGKSRKEESKKRSELGR